MAHYVFSDGLPTKSRHLSRSSTEPNRTQTSATIVCYITQADSNVLQVEVEHKALGQDVLDKICRELGIVEEADYFGLQFVSSKNELLWINNRNRLSKQIPTSPPYHLYFRVKFFILPEDILLEGTRLQFYINVVRQLKEGVWDAETTLQTQAHLIALMAYVRFGKYNQNTTPCKYACFWPDNRGEIPPEAIRLAANFHRSLEGCTAQHVQYELLRLVATEVPCYGMYFYEVKDIFERRLLFGVGPQAVFLCSSSSTIDEKFPYCRIQTITTSSRVVTLNLLEDDGTVKPRNYQLASFRMANALYRSVNEVYAFFRCDSVKKEVLAQTRRDLFDAISFHHNGKEYAFDVCYTSREVYDRARRHLYHCTSNTTPHESPPNFVGVFPSSLTEHSILASCSESGAFRASGDVISGSLKRDYSSRAESFVSDEELQELVQKCLVEIGLCRLCFNAPISRVFLPCGHIICCVECSERIEECSVCRQPIVERHPCFLPWDTEISLDHLVHSESRRIRRQSEASSSMLSTSGPNIPHTASAPTCSLFSLPSTTCVDPSAPQNRMTPDQESSASETLAPLHVEEAASSAMHTNNSHNSSDTPTPCDTPVHTYSSASKPSSDITTVTVSRSHQPTPSIHPLTEPSGVEIVRRPAHVTWQLSDG